MEDLECPLCQQRTLFDPYRGIGYWYCRCSNCQSIIKLHRKGQHSFKVVEVVVDNRKRSNDTG